MGIIFDTAEDEVVRLVQNDGYSVKAAIEEVKQRQKRKKEFIDEELEKECSIEPIEEGWKDDWCNTAYGIGSLYNK